MCESIPAASNVPAASQVVSGICRAELQRFEGDVASDLDLARAFRKEKKAVLEACLRACQ